MKQIEIVNTQTSGKYAGSTRSINVPDWLDHVKGRPDPPAFGNYKLFMADPDIDQGKAFASLCSYAMQHLPVAFRSKLLTAQSCYSWLRGEMQGGDPQKTACLNYLVNAGMDVRALKDSKVKALKEMIRQMHIILPELPLTGINLEG